MKASYVTVKAVILRCSFHDSGQQLFNKLERNVYSKTLLFSSISDDERSSSAPLCLAQYFTAQGAECQFPPRDRHPQEHNRPKPCIITLVDTTLYLWSLPWTEFLQSTTPPGRQILVLNVHSIKIHTNYCMFKDNRKKTYKLGDQKHWLSLNTISKSYFYMCDLIRLLTVTLLLTRFGSRY